MPKRTLIIGGLLALVIVVYVMGGGSKTNKDTSTAAAADMTQCRVTVSADILRVRSAPDPAAGVVGMFKHGSELSAAKEVTNGFRKIADNRWASAQFLQPVAGHDCG